MAIYKRGKTWWMDVYVGVERRRVRRSTGCEDKTEARIVEQSAIALNRGITTRQKAMRIIDAILPKEERGLSVGEIQAWYEQTAALERMVPSKHEMQKRLRAIGRMSMWIQEHTRVTLAEDIDAEVAWKYSQHFGSRGVTVKTQNNEVGQLRTVWELLIRHGKAHENPWSRARAARNRDEETSGRAFTGEEVERILAECRRAGYEWEGVCLTALYTGLRRRDVETLRWENVDWEKMEIRLTPSKTARKGIKVRIPLHRRLAEVLRGLWAAGKGEADGARAQTEAGRNGYIFPWRAGHPVKAETHYGDVTFGEILQRAGVTAGEGEKISFHCWRHTFVSRLAEAGVSEEVRMRLAGHTNAATHEAYTHDDVSGRKAIDALE